MIHIRNISSLLSVQDQNYAPTTKPVRVYSGDVVTCTTPAVLHTLLGSCVAVCLHDPVLRVGGMNHILLPGSFLGRRSTRFGVYAMELLINELMKHGCERRRFVAQAFGGATVRPESKASRIGDENAKFVHEFLAAEKIPLLNDRMRGSYAVHVHFRTQTGKAIVHAIKGSLLQKILHAEESYRRLHQEDAQYSGEITLF